MYLTWCSSVFKSLAMLPANMLNYALAICRGSVNKSVSFGTVGLGQVVVLTHRFDEYLLRKVSPKNLKSVGLLRLQPSPGLADAECDVDRYGRGNQELHEEPVDGLQLAKTFSSNMISIGEAS